MVNGGNVGVPLHCVLDHFLGGKNCTFDSYITRVQKNKFLLSVPHSCSNVHTYQITVTRDEMKSVSVNLHPYMNSPDRLMLAKRQWCSSIDYVIVRSNMK